MERLGRYSVYVCVCVCVCVLGGRLVPGSHRCTAGDVTLHIDFTVSDHHAIYLEKCFSMAHLQRGRGGTFEGMNMQMNTPGEEGNHSQLLPEPFTLGKGKAWDGERGRGREEAGNGKKRRR